MGTVANSSQAHEYILEFKILRLHITSLIHTGDYTNDRNFYLSMKNLILKTDFFVS